MIFSLRKRSASHNARFFNRLIKTAFTIVEHFTITRAIGELKPDVTDTLINSKNGIVVCSGPRGSICSMQIWESFWDLAVF